MNSKQFTRTFIARLGLLAVATLLMVTAAGNLAFAHRNHQLQKVEARPAPESKDQEWLDRLAQVNESYVRDVKPIFLKKCMDCHSDQTRFPWYSSIPGVEQLIQSDIKEAKEHIDMSKDFPFAGHGEPIEDLEELLETVNTGSMPPLRYKILHWGSGLTETEKKTIRQWIREGLKILSPNSTESKSGHSKD